VSETLKFTWGTGTYVAPLAQPFSGAIFDRVLDRQRVSATFGDQCHQSWAGSLNDRLDGAG